MLHMDIMTVYCKHHTEHKYVLCGRTAEFLVFNQALYRHGYVCIELDLRLKSFQLRNNIYETHAEYFFAGLKAQREEGGGRILLGDNKDGGAVILRPIRFRCSRSRISTGLSCTYI